MKRFEYYVRDAAYDNMARDKELENKRLTRNQRRQNRKKVAYFSFLILLLFSLVLLLCTSVVEHRTLRMIKHKMLNLALRKFCLVTKVNILPKKFYPIRSQMQKTEGYQEMMFQLLDMQVWKLMK